MDKKKIAHRRSSKHDSQVLCNQKAKDCWMTSMDELTTCKKCLKVIANKIKSRAPN